METNLLVTILTSSLLSGIAGALIVGYWNLLIKKSEYRHEYYKLILSRRIAAYEQLEELIVWLRVAVSDTDQRPYHLLFSLDGDWETAYQATYKVTTQALWLSDEVFAKAKELNVLLYRPSHADKGAIEFGKSNYNAIANIRESLESLLAKDMLTLYDVKSFLKAKRTRSVIFPQVLKNG